MERDAVTPLKIFMSDWKVFNDSFTDLHYFSFVFLREILKATQICVRGLIIPEPGFVGETPMENI